MAQRARNILLVWTDQQRPDTIGAFDNADIRTPALDQLAASACLFERAYAAEPVCTPSRTTVLTGLYPHTHRLIANGQVLSPDVPTLAELLRPAGYVCGYAGKWHLGNEVPPQRGFEAFWAGTEDRYTDDSAAEGHSAYHRFLVSRGYAPPSGGTFSRAEAAALLEAGETAPDEADLVVEWNGPFRVQNLEQLRARGHLDGISADDPRLTRVTSRTIRRGRWKLTPHASGEHELYDLQADPGEMHNAFWDPGVGDVIVSLTERLRRWQRETGDSFVIPELTHDPSRVRV